MNWENHIGARPGEGGASLPLSPTAILMGILALSFLFHGSIIIYSYPNTYDNFVHTFFADHYARDWFEPWEYRWYTGFTTTSYPPLVHMGAALLSKLVGLKAGMMIVGVLAVNTFVVGVYRFGRIWVDERSALAGAFFAIFAPSIVEALHVFGQVPTLVGIAFLLNGTVEAYKWLRTKKTFYLISALSLFSVTVAAHHVTTIFGLVFFVAPVFLTALFDRLGVQFRFTWPIFWAWIQEIWKFRFRIALFLGAFIFLLVFVVFPYWYWSKTDPITQVPIPHGSRDSFIINKSSGIVFFIIPWGVVLPLLPFIFKKILTGRNIFIGLSFSLLVLLGTGGTTPIPKMLLGENAFNILTLDRFTFWASVMAIPFAGHFFLRFIALDIRDSLNRSIGRLMTILLQGVVTIYIITQTVVIVNLVNFKPMQPASIDINPIVNFLDRDEHYRWRFLTLGFGDQVAWLSANTTAKSIDGNYHSARRVPELTSRAIERLENCKFNGVEGLGSLQQFLTVPEKYYLKYIFSNDKFYDPLLHYAGWHRVQRLENGIMVWEKQDIRPLPPRLPLKVIPRYQKIMWGTLPLLCLLTAIFINLYLRLWLFRLKERGEENEAAFAESEPDRRPILWGLSVFLSLLLPPLMFWWSAKEMYFDDPQATPDACVNAYYDAWDFKRFKEAHSYFDPLQKLNFEQYILEISVDDGLVNSYAKMDAIRTEVTGLTDSTALVRAMTDWITPLQSYTKDEEHLLIKRNGHWYIKRPKRFDISIPPDQFISQPAVRYFKQGKRRVSTEPSPPDDVVDRPELYVHDARLVRKDSIVSVVGEIQNTDNLPAHITITAELYDSLGQVITAYNCQFATQHKLLPKEKTPFRIDFERLAWREDDERRPQVLNPDEFTPYFFERQPVRCRIYAKAVAENTDIYKYGNLHGTHVVHQGDSTWIEGQVVNTGVDEITIPQLIVGYYQGCELVWADHHFIPNAARPQRDNDFRYLTENLDNVEVIYVTKSNERYVNGLDQSTFLKGRDIDPCNDFFREISDDTKVKISVNSFVGIPSLY